MDTSTIKNEQPSPSNEPTLDEKEHIRLERIVRVGINRLVDRIQNAEIALSGAEVEIEINRISKETGVSTKSLVSTLKKQTGGNAKDQKPQATKPAAEQPEVDEETKRNADEAFNKLQNHSNLFGVFQKHLRFAGYIANRHLADGLLMSHGARLLPKPTTFATTGEPGSGKSDCFDVGGEFLPPECVLRFTTCSAKALLYLGDISHRVLLLGEMNPTEKDADDPRQEILRQLISGVTVTNLIVDRDDHNRLSQRITSTKAEGTVVCFTSITEQHHWDSQMRSRTSWLSSDESDATTLEVMRAIAKTSGKKPPDKKLQQAVHNAWQQFHRTLQPLGVYIPFADDDAFIPKAQHIFMRRTFWLLIRYIQISCLLHQHVRARHTDGRVIATPDDYKNAHDLLVASAPRRTRLVAEKAAKMFADILKPELEAQGGELSAPQIIKLLKTGKSTGYNWIGDYVAAGWLEPTAETKKNRSKKYSLMDDISQPADELGLPTPDMVERIYLTMYPDWKTGIPPESMTNSVIPIPTSKLESNWKVENHKRDCPSPTVVQNDDWKSERNLAEGFDDVSSIPGDDNGYTCANVESIRQDFETANEFITGSEAQVIYPGGKEERLD